MARKSSQKVTQQIRCNTCRTKTEHRLIKKVKGDTGSEPYEEDYQYAIHWETTFDLLQCCGCLEILLRRTYEFSEWDYPDIRFFPPRISRHPPTWTHNLPEELRSLVGEVYRSLDADNLSLPMMGARALVDMVMVEKVGDVGGFAQKLKELERAGFVSAKNREVLEAALDVGNAAAHRGYAAKISQVNLVMNIVENLIEAVYILPDAAQELKKSTPPRRKPKT